MARSLPSLNALRAFEATARHGGYSQAAQELCVTHAAVSQQVRLLEESIGARLLVRSGRGMKLTEAGQALQVSVRNAFRLLERGVAEVRQQHCQQRLKVNLLPAFAARWLVPRLPDFHARHPQIDVHLHASLTLVDFEREAVDLAIRFGLGKWPGLQAEKLLDEDLFPVCSPAYRRGRIPRTPRELLDCELLHDPYYPWEEWFQSARVDIEAPLRGTLFGDSNMLLAAAVQGHGVALTLGHLVQKELSNRQLVRCAASQRTSFAYFVVIREGGELQPRVRLFKQWLLDQARPDS